MPRLPDWLVILCIMLPIVSLINRSIRNNRKK
jgi:hypothetical protein